MWLSRVLNMEDKLELIFESYKSLGEKYKYCAGNIWANKNLELKKTGEENGDPGKLAEENFNKLSYIFQEDAQKAEFYKMAKNSSRTNLDSME